MKVVYIVLYLVFMFISIVQSGIVVTKKDGNLKDFFELLIADIVFPPFMVYLQIFLLI